MSDKGFFTDWCDKQLDLYHAPRTIGDPMADWLTFDHEQKRIWKEINERSVRSTRFDTYDRFEDEPDEYNDDDDEWSYNLERRAVPAPAPKKKSDSKGSLTLGEVILLDVIMWTMMAVALQYKGDWSLLGIVGFALLFLGTVLGFCVWSVHKN